MIFVFSIASMDLIFFFFPLFTSNLYEITLNGFFIIRDRWGDRRQKVIIIFLLSYSRHNTYFHANDKKRSLNFSWIQVTAEDILNQHSLGLIRTHDFYNYFLAILLKAARLLSPLFTVRAYSW
jgi:hypothetical protein